jgi:hypothetical protein
MTQRQASNRAVRLALSHGGGVGGQCVVLLRLPATLRAAVTGFADTAQTRQRHIAQNCDVIGNSWDKPRDV